MTEPKFSMNGVEKVVKDTKFFIPEWDMRTQMRNSKFVLPLVSEPMANAIAVSDENDKGMYAAAIIKGITHAIAECDLEEIVPKLIDGVIYLNENGVPKQVTLKILEDELKMNFFDVIRLCVEIIKVNVDPLFDGGLQALMTEL